MQREDGEIPLPPFTMDGEKLLLTGGGESKKESVKIVDLSSYGTWGTPVRWCERMWGRGWR